MDLRQFNLIFVAFVTLLMVFTAARCKAVPTGSNEPVFDCARIKSHYPDTLPGIFRALAEADIVLESKRMTIDKLGTDGQTAITVKVDCLLKGDPRVSSLAVRLLPNANGTRCIDAETLGSVTTNHPNGRFIFALSRPVQQQPIATAWDLLDGGLFDAQKFYQRLDENTCRAVSIYNGNCSRTSQDGHTGCPLFEMLAKSMSMKVKPAYYASAAEPIRNGQQDVPEPLQPPPQPSPPQPSLPQTTSLDAPTRPQQEQRKPQQPQQQQQQQDDAGMLASDQPVASSATKKLGGNEALLAAADSGGGGGSKGSGSGNGAPTVCRLAMAACLALLLVFN